MRRFNSRVLKMMRVKEVFPLVSVVVPVYHVEKYMYQCLDSIVGQTYKNLEIICVNDGATDNSPEILKEYQRRDSRIKIINQLNQGLSAARNTGLQYVTGDLVVFVDSDDWLEKTAIASTYKVFENKNVDFVCYGTMCRYEGNSQKDSYGHIYERNEIKDIEASWIIRASVSAWAKMYRTSFLKEKELLFPVGMYYEDIPFYWGCVSFAKQVALSDAVLYNYRIRDDSIMGLSKTKKKGMAIHHLYELQNVYQIWSQNGFLKTNRNLFQYLFEVYAQEGWKYLHDDDKAEYKAEALACAQKWGVYPRRFTLAYDLIAGNSIFMPKYRWARSLRKRYWRLLERFGRSKCSAILTP